MEKIIEQKAVLDDGISQPASEVQQVTQAPCLIPVSSMDTAPSISGDERRLVDEPATEVEAAAAPEPTDGPIIRKSAEPAGGLLQHDGGVKTVGTADDQGDEAAHEPAAVGVPAIKPAVDVHDGVELGKLFHISHEFVHLWYLLNLYCF